MSTTRKLSRGDWKDYFDGFTRKFLKEDTPGAASIEIISPTLGDQFEVSAVRGQYAPRLLVGEPTQQGSCRAQHRSFGSHRSAEHSAGLVPAQ